jgi:hypothetical protein
MKLKKLLLIFLFAFFSISAWAGNDVLSLSDREIFALKAVSRSQGLQVNVMSREDRNNQDMIILIGLAFPLDPQDGRRIGILIRRFSEDKSYGCTLSAQNTWLSSDLKTIETHCGAQTDDLAEVSEEKVEFQNIEGSHRQLGPNAKKIDSILRYVERGSTGLCCASVLMQRLSTTQQNSNCTEGDDFNLATFMSGSVWSATSLTRWGLQRWCSELSPTEVPDEMIKVLRESEKSRMITLVRNPDFSQVVKGLQKLGFEISDWNQALQKRSF